MGPDTQNPMKLIRIIPLIMLGMFVLFWSMVNILNSQYYFTIPSVLIVGTVIVRLVAKK